MRYLAMLDHAAGWAKPVALLILLLVIVSGPPQVFGTESSAAVRVVVNRAVRIDRLEREELERIYLGKKTLWDSGGRIAPCLLSEESPVTQGFLEAELRKTVHQFRAYWKRRLFSGGGAAPRTFHSQEELLDFVASNEGSIGVVDASVSDDRVTVIALQ